MFMAVCSDKPLVIKFDLQVNSIVIPTHGTAKNHRIEYP